MIEKQEKLVNEIVKRIENCPYLMVHIPSYDRVEWLHDLHLIVTVAMLNFEYHMMEEETLS